MLSALREVQFEDTAGMCLIVLRICLNQKNSLLHLNISLILGSTAKCCDKKNESHGTTGFNIFSSVPSPFV